MLTNKKILKVDKKDMSKVYKKKTLTVYIKNFTKNIQNCTINQWIHFDHDTSKGFSMQSFGFM